MMPRHYFIAAMRYAPFRHYYAISWPADAAAGASCFAIVFAAELFSFSLITFLPRQRRAMITPFCRRRCQPLYLLADLRRRDADLTPLPLLLRRRCHYFLRH